jgi:hypothetical protein
VTGKRYQCSQCKGWFMSGWSDADAMEESRRNFPEVGPKAPLAEICDVCHAEFMRWLDAHPEQRHRHGF